RARAAGRDLRGGGSTVAIEEGGERGGHWPASSSPCPRGRWRSACSPCWSRCAASPSTCDGWRTRCSALEAHRDAAIEVAVGADPLRLVAAQQRLHEVGGVLAAVEHVDHAATLTGADRS